MVEFDFFQQLSASISTFNSALNMLWTTLRNRSTKQSNKCTVPLGLVGVALSSVDNRTDNPRNAKPLDSSSCALKAESEIPSKR